MFPGSHFLCCARLGSVPPSPPPQLPLPLLLAAAAGTAATFIPTIPTYDYYHDHDISRLRGYDYDSEFE